jgi:predicted nucleic acid-binding protein
MRITIDLNVVLDVYLERDNFLASAEILTLCKERAFEGCIPSHGIPTIYYVLRSKIGHERAIAIVDRLIEMLTVVPVGNELLRSARRLPFRDFEDAIVAASAVESKSEFIITKNSRDFPDSPIPAITPERFMREIDLSFGR